MPELTAAEQQQKEIDTIKPRALELKLSDADYQKIAEKAAVAEMTVSELLESFIGDLVNGTYSNGSDERDRANSWYERCGFDFCNNFSFLHYLISEYVLDDFVDAWLDFDVYRDDVENCKNELENPTEKWSEYIKSDGTPAYATLEEYLQSVKDDCEEFTDYMNAAAEEVEEHWNAYLKWTQRTEPNKEEEIDAVMKWHEKYVPREE